MTYIRLADASDSRLASFVYKLTVLEQTARGQKRALCGQRDTHASPCAKSLHERWRWSIADTTYDTLLFLLHITRQIETIKWHADELISSAAIFTIILSRPARDFLLHRDLAIRTYFLLWWHRWAQNRKLDHSSSCVNENNDIPFFV